MENAKKNVALLAGCRAMLFANNVALISLADNEMRSTLPATAYVVGAAISWLALRQRAAVAA